MANTALSKKEQYYAEKKKREEALHANTQSRGIVKESYQEYKQRRKAEEAREYANEATLADDYARAMDSARKVYTQWTPVSDMNTFTNEFTDVRNRVKALDEADEYATKSYRKNLSLLGLANAGSITKKDDIATGAAQALNQRRNATKHTLKQANEVLEGASSLADTYKKYSNKEDYDKALHTQGIKDKYRGASYDQIKKAYEETTDPEEKKYLADYGVNVGYQHWSDYDKEIADLEEQIERTPTSYHKRQLNQKLDELKAGRNLAYHNPSRYNYLMNASDFEEKSKNRYTKSELNDLFGESFGQQFMNALGGKSNMPVYEYAEQMTSDEKKILSYLIERDKEDGTDRAREYLANIQPTLSARDTEEMRQRAADLADSGFWGKAASTIASIGINAVTSLPAAAETFRNTLTGRYDDSWNKLNSIGTMTREEVSKDLSEDYGAWAGWLYDVGTSVADSYIGMSMGKSWGKVGENIHLAIMGAGAANQHMRELREQGASDGQIIIGGALTGIAEALFEKISLDKLLKEKSLATTRDRVKAILGQMFTEGSEEINTEIANLITDQIVRGGASEYNQKVREYMKQGMTREEAMAQATNDVVAQIALAGAGGALSGFALGSIDVKQRSKKYGKIGENMSAEEKADIRDLAEHMEGTESYEKLQSMRDNLSEKASNIEAGELKEQVREDFSKGIADAIKGDRTEVSNAVNRHMVREYASEMDGARKEAFQKHYDGNMDADDYYNRFSFLYEYGEKQVENEQSADATLEKIEDLRGGLSLEAAKDIYKAGIQARNAAIKSEQNARDKITQKYYKATRGKFTYTDDVKPYMRNAKDRRAISPSMMNDLANALGVNIEVRVGKPKQEGNYDPSSNTITVYINAENQNGAGTQMINGEEIVTKDVVITALSHELSHWAETKSPELYSSLADIIIEAEAKAKGVTRTEYILQAAENLKKLYSGNEDIKNKPTDMDGWTNLAMQEVVARACDGMLTDKRVMARILSKLNQNQKEAFNNEVKGLFRRFINWIKDIMSTYRDKASEEYRLLRNLKEYYEKAWKTYADMIEEASRVNRAMENAKEQGVDLESEYGVKDEEKGKLYSVSLSEDEKKQRLATIRNNMSARVSGNALSNAMKVADAVLSSGGQVDDYGFIDAWYRTSNHDATSIQNSKKIKTTGNTFTLSTRREGRIRSQGSTAVKMNIPSELTKVAARFDDEVQLIVPTGKHGSLDVEAYLASPYDYAHVIWMGDKGKIQLAKILDKAQVPKLSSVKYDKMTAIWNVIEQTNHKQGEKSGTFHNKYEDVDIVVNRHSFEHSGNHAENVVLISSTKELVENAIKVNELGQNRSRNISDVYLAVGIDDSGNEYVVRLTVEHTANGRQLTGYDYLYAIYSKEGGQRKLNTAIVSPQSALPHHPPVVSIADLLNEVKDAPALKDTVSLNVLAHLGVERGENQFTDRLLYSVQTPEGKSLYDLSEPLVIRQDNTAGLTDETLDAMLKNYAASNPNYAQAYITYMTPEDFLKLTTTNQSRIAEESKKIDYDELSEIQKDQAIQLTISENEDGEWEVEGHEGRHRMYALMQDGVKKVPVLIRDLSNKYSKEKHSKATLVQQDFGRDDYEGIKVSIGNTIPFSNGNKEEIRKTFGVESSAGKLFSIQLDRDTSLYDLAGENERLQEENEQLRKDRDNLKALIKMDKTLTHGRVLKEGVARKAAKGLIEKTILNYDVDTLTERLEELYGILLDGDKAEKGAYEANLAELAHELAKHNKRYKLDDDARALYKEVRSLLRSKKIYLDEEQYNNAVSALGGKKYWWKEVFGILDVSTKDKSNRTNIDTIYNELRNDTRFAGIFPDVKDVDMLPTLLETYRNLQEAETAYVEYYDADAERYLEAEIENQLYHMEAIKTSADKYAEKVGQIRKEHQQTISEMREQFKKLEKDYHELGKEYFDTVEEIVGKYSRRLEAQKAKAKERLKKSLDRYRDAMDKRSEIRKILDRAKTLNKWMVKNSAKEHVPDALKAPVAELLNALDFSSRRLLKGGAPTQKDISLAKTFEKVRKFLSDYAAGKEDVDGYLDLPDGFAQEFDDLNDKIKKIAEQYGDNSNILNAMSVEDLKELRRAVTIVKGAVNKANKLLANAAYATASAAAQDTIIDLETLGDKGKEPNEASICLNYKNALPIYVFDRFGKGGQEMFKEMMAGWGKFAFHIDLIKNFAEQTFTAKERDDWGKETHKFHVDGKDVTMTTAQLMSLYCLSKREQAKLHLSDGGIRVEDIKAGKEKGKSQTDNYRLSEEDLTEMFDGENGLTKRQKAVANKLQEFMNTVCSDWGNEISLIRYGIKQFLEKNYFPIESNANLLKGEDTPQDSMTSLFRLLNMSFTKELTKNANNPIMVRDIFDVFGKHASDMAKYNALALPALDMYKWFSYRENIPELDENGKVLTKDGKTVIKERISTKQSIDKAYGDVAKKYIETFLKDINGEYSGGREEGVQNKLMAHYKLAAVAYNLRVALLQPTSYFRASAVLSPTDMGYGLVHRAKREKVMNNSGTAVWKNLGFYDTNVQRNVQDLISQKKTVSDKIAEVGMKGAEIGDRETWLHLWAACEHAVMREQPNLKYDSKEFLKAVGEKFDDVIYRTQVMDSTMTRSQYMRSKSGLAKLVTAFMSEPTVSLNLVTSKFQEYKRIARAEGKSAALKKIAKPFAKAMLAYLSTSLVNALAEAAVDAWRKPEGDDEDTTFGENYSTAFGNQFWENIIEDVDILEKLPLVKDAVQGLKLPDLAAWGINQKRHGKDLTGEDWRKQWVSLLNSAMFSSGNRMDEAWIESLSKTGKDTAKLLGGDSTQIYSTVYDYAKALSQLSGIPIAPIWREFEPMWDNTIGEAYPSMNLKKSKFNDKPKETKKDINIVDKKK